MRIGIDISTILNHGKDVGAGRYITNLIKNLFELDFEDEFILTGRYQTNEYLWLAEELKHHYIKVNEKALKTASPGSNPLKENNRKKNLSNGTCMTSRLSFKLIKTSGKKIDLSNSLGFPPMEFYGFKADIFHCPDFLIPPTLNNRIILTIHDLAFIRYQHFNFEWFVRKYTKLVKRNSYSASAILADSTSTKNDIVNFFGIKEDKVTVIPLAAEEVFKKLDESEIDYSLLVKYKITKKFLLSVGTIEPRKNYVALIRIFNRVKCEKPQNYDSDLQLVIVGRTGWMSEDVIKEYKQSPYREDIILAGRLSDAELLQMYNMAQLFIYPSIFEGFGLPVVEAMQCGLPVIASNSSSIPEIVDDKKMLFNPTDEGSILDKISLVLGNEKYRAELSEKVRKNAAKFSWKRTSQKTLEVYKEIFKT